MTERMCIATRTVRPVDELIRFVVGPQGDVVPDILCKLPGRGVWVEARAKSVDQAVMRKLFARGFKTAVKAGADLVTLVGELLRRRAMDLLSLAQKAGLVRCGFEKVLEAARAGNVSALVHAADGSRDGIRKLQVKIAALGDDRRNLPVIEVFQSHELDLALGRTNVIHAALNDGRLTSEYVAAARKFEIYRSGDDRFLQPALDDAGPH